MKLYLLFIFLTVQLFNISMANAEKIRWVTESWQNYTNKDGSGLYHEILQGVFADHQLEVSYIPWKRALMEVKNGTADITGATSVKADYHIPRYPILAPPVSILFNKTKMTYTNSASLKNYIAVWAAPYEEELLSDANKALVTGFSVQERQTAYKMLVSGRADYFLDAKALHHAWLEQMATRPNGKLTATDYQLEDIGQLKLFMIFSKNARGQRLKDIYEQGMSKLRKEGELRKIYAKYNFLAQMPPGPSQQ